MCRDGYYVRRIKRSRGGRKLRPYYIKGEPMKRNNKISVMMLGLGLISLLLGSCDFESIFETSPSPSSSSSKVSTHTGSTGNSTSSSKSSVIHVSGIKLEEERISLTVGQTRSLHYRISPENADDQRVIWSSSNEEVALVTSTGLVVASKPGTALVSVTTVDGGHVASCAVLVEDKAVSTIPVEGIAISPSEKEMDVGDQLQLTVTLSPANATNQKYTLVSSNPEIVSIDGMVAIAIAPGEASIVAQSEDGGFTAACAITVKGGSAPVYEVPLDDFGETNDEILKAIDTSSVYPAGENTTALDPSVLEQYKNDTKVGYGYSITCEKPIYDPDAIMVTHPILKQDSPVLKNSLYYDNASSQKAYSKKTNRQSEFAEEYGLNVSAGINSQVYCVNAGIDSLFDKNTSLGTLQRESYEIYSMTIRRGRVICQLGLDALRNCLDPQFERDLTSVATVNDAHRLFNNYGTHMIRGYSLGGVMEISNYYATNSASYTQQNTLSLQSQLTAAVGAANIGSNFSFEQVYGSKENAEYAESNYNFRSFGGDATQAMSINHLFTFGETLAGYGYVYGNWINSINQGESLTIVGVPEQTAMIPLWNLLPNEPSSARIRNLLVQTYLKECKTKYDAYIAEHPDCAVTTVDLSEEEADVALSLNGYTVKRGDEIHYTETENSFSDLNIKVLDGDILALDMEGDQYASNVEWSVSAQDASIRNLTFDGTQGAYANGVYKLTLYRGKASGSVVFTIKVGATKRVFTVTVSRPNASYSGGVGSEADPYLISNADQFKKYIEEGEDFDKYVKLTTDIRWLNTELLTPSGAELTGGFDGNFCTISNFKIANAGNGNETYALFERNNGTITNLTVSNATVAVGKHLEGYSAMGFDTFPDSKEQYRAKWASIVVGTNGSEGLIKNVTVTQSILGLANAKNDAGTATQLNAGLICANNEGTMELCFTSESRVLVETDSEDRDGLVTSIGSVCASNSGTVEKAQSESDVISLYMRGWKWNSEPDPVGYMGLIGKAGANSTNRYLVSRSINARMEIYAANDKLLYEPGSDRAIYIGGLIGYLDSGATCQYSAATQTENVLGGPNYDDSYKYSRIRPGQVFGFRHQNAGNVDKVFYQVNDSLRGINAVGGNENPSESMLRGISSRSSTIRGSDIGAPTGIFKSGDAALKEYKVESIAVTFAKTDFIVGQVMNPGKITVTATMENGEEMEVSSYSLDGLFTQLREPNPNRAFTAKAYGKTDTVSISVAPATLVGITCEVAQSKTQFYFGETVKASDFVLYCQYDFGEKVQITNYSAVKVEPFVPELGKNIVTLTYGDFHCKVEVEFMDREIKSVQASWAVKGRTFRKGDVVSGSDVELLVTYADGYSETISGDKAELLNTTIVTENQSITIVYGDYIIATLDVDVID